MPVDDRWSKLSMRDRADLIKIYTKHGVTDLNEIRRHYNSFQDPVFEDRSKPKADLYNRLVDEKDNRSIKIGDSIGTHLMSWATVDDKPVGYSQIQPDNNGNLKDYGDKALDRSIERGDTIQFRDEKDADWWTSNNYKQFYKKMTPAYDEYRREKLKERYPFYNTDVMNTKANGGHLYQGDSEPTQQMRTLYDEASDQIYGILPVINITAKAPKGYNGYPRAFEKEYNNNGGIYGGFTNKDRAYKEWIKTQKYFSPEAMNERSKPWLPFLAGAALAPAGLIVAPIVGGSVASTLPAISAEASEALPVLGNLALKGIKYGIPFATSLATGELVNDVIRDNGDYNGFGDWAYTNLYGYHPTETEEFVSDFFNPGYIVGGAAPSIAERLFGNGVSLGQKTLPYITKNNGNDFQGVIKSALSKTIGLSKNDLPKSPNRILINSDEGTAKEAILDATQRGGLESKSHTNLYFYDDGNGGIYGNPKIGESVIYPKGNMQFHVIDNNNMNFVEPEFKGIPYYEYYTKNILGRYNKHEFKPSPHNIFLQRILSAPPSLKADGTVRLVPDDNALANFTTNGRFTPHRYYSESSTTDLTDLYSFPSDALYGTGAKAISLEPNDTFFLNSQLRLLPSAVTYSSPNVSRMKTAKDIGFELGKSDRKSSKVYEKMKKLLSEDLSNKGEHGLKDLLSATKYDFEVLSKKERKILNMTREKNLKYSKHKNYVALEDMLGEKIPVEKYNNQLSYLKKMLLEYKKDPVSFHEKYGDFEFTLPNGRTIGIQDIYSKELQSMLKTKYNDVFYDPVPTTEHDILKEIGLDSHPRNLSEEDYLKLIEYVNNLKIKPFQNGGHLYQSGGSRNNPPKRISSLLDPDKVRNRLPADASKYLGLDPFGITNTMTAGLQYIFNNDNTVQDKLNEKYEILRKTDDDWKAYHEKLKKSGHNVIDWKTTKRRLLDLANDYIGLEDAKDIYLNTQQRSNTFYPSKERPTIGNIENVWASKYLSSPTVVEDYILPAIRNIRTKNTVKNAQGAPLGSIEKIGKSGKNGVSFLPILGHATVGYGTDPYRGSYVSYYDKWDVNMGGKKGGADVVKYILGGTPVNIYDRIYLDDYYGYNSVNDYNNSKKEDQDITYGGWLPEVDISANTKANGGHLFQIGGYKEIPPYLPQGYFPEIVSRNESAKLYSNDTDTREKAVNNIVNRANKKAEAKKVVERFDPEIVEQNNIDGVNMWLTLAGLRGADFVFNPWVNQGIKAAAKPILGGAKRLTSKYVSPVINELGSGLKNGLQNIQRISITNIPMVYPKTILSDLSNMFNSGLKRTKYKDLLEERKALELLTRDGSKEDVLKRLNHIYKSYNIKPIPSNVAKLSDSEFLEYITKELKKQNTYVRGVRLKPEDYLLSEKEQLEKYKYYATHYAGDTGHGKAGITTNDKTPFTQLNYGGEGTIYLSNSYDQADAYALRSLRNIRDGVKSDGKIAKVRIPLTPYKGDMYQYIYDNLPLPTTLSEFATRSQRILLPNKDAPSILTRMHDIDNYGKRFDILINDPSYKVYKEAFDNGVLRPHEEYKKYKKYRSIIDYDNDLIRRGIGHNLSLQHTILRGPVGEDSGLEVVDMLDPSIFNIFRTRYHTGRIGKDLSNFAQGGNLGHITPYGQWQYPHQVTTIPSNNITMKGVDYPVVGVSDTGDKKLMLPGLDYLYDGNYVTEYPLSNKK